eukprot:scaffold22589_cov138-Cylindrotheca_fusiformis.AAC.25
MAIEKRSHPLEGGLAPPLLKSNRKLMKQGIMAQRQENVCSLCRYDGSDIRIVGCGCTIHAVSFKEKGFHCLDGWNSSVFRVFVRSRTYWKHRALSIDA